MKERLSDLKNLKDRVFIGTIHDFALNILRSRRHELGIDEMPQIIDREADRRELLAEVISENPLLARHYNQLPNNPDINDLKKHQRNLIEKSLKFISRKKQELVWLGDSTGDVDIKEWTPGRVGLYQDYNTLLFNQNLIDYDDILLLAWRILNERVGVAKLYQRMYKHVLVDEAQDLSFAQYELVKSLCGDKIKSVMLVGDANQAIHGYAGANSKYMQLDFPKDFSLSESQKKKINFNYRSSKAIVSLAEKLSNTKQNRQESFYEGNVNFFSFENENAEAVWVIDKIKELLKETSDKYDGELTLNKIAVLGRNKFVFNEISSVLEEDEALKSNFYLKRGSETLQPESTMMKVFDLGTRVLCNQKAYIYLSQLLELTNQDGGNINAQDANSIEILKRTLKSAKIDFLEEFVKKEIVISWENLDKDINLFPPISEWKSAWGQYIRSVSSGAKSVADFRRFIAMGSAQVKNQRGLTLATIHTVKGLEYHVVFLIGAGEGTFPDYRAVKSGNLLEEQNSAYVAITRAKREIFISYPKAKQVPWGEIQQKQSSLFPMVFTSKDDHTVETLR